MSYSGYTSRSVTAVVWRIFLFAVVLIWSRPPSPWLVQFACKRCSCEVWVLCLPCRRKDECLLVGWLASDLLVLRWWIPDNVSVSLVSVPPVGQSQVRFCLVWISSVVDTDICRIQSATGLSNSTSIQEVFRRTSQTVRLISFSGPPINSSVNFFFLSSLPRCSSEKPSCIGELVNGYWLFSYLGFWRYTGEGMDIMEFSEAESNTHDLMYVILKPSWSEN